MHLRVDPETFAFFRAAGKGHLTRMAKVLKAYAQSHGKPSKPAESGVVALAGPYEFKASWTE